MEHADVVERNEQNVLPLLAHLYGPSLGREAARMVQAGEDERIVILEAEPSSPPGWLPAGTTTEERGRYETEEREPFPFIEFLRWQGAELTREALTCGWDVLVGVPPVSRGRDDAFVRLLEVLAETANPGARAVLFLLPGPLVQRQAETRAGLLDRGSVRELFFTSRSGQDRPGLPTGIPPVLVHWRPGVTGGVTDVATDVEGRTGFSVTLDAEPPWTHAGLDPARAKRIARWAKQGSARPLRDLVSMPRGKAQGPGDRPVLHPQQIVEGGIDLSIEVSRQPDRRKRPEPLIELQAGDLVGRTIGDPRWTVLSDNDVADGLCTYRQVTVLRPTEIDPRYLLAFLRSDIAADQLSVATAGATIPRVPMSALRELLVPVLELDEAALDQADPIAGFRNLASGLAHQLETRYRAAFDLPQATDVTAALQEAHRDARMAEGLLRQVTSPVHQARQYLPHPLARTLRVLDNHRQANNQAEIYKDLLRFGETAIILLGGLGLAYMVAEGEEVDSGWATALRRGGVSLGHWLGAANAAAVFARRQGHSLGGLARALSTNSPLNRTLSAFLRARQDDAHGAGPRSPFEYQQRVLELDEVLDDAIEELSPLSRSDWFVVEHLAWLPANGAFKLTGRSLKGDHPDFEHWEERRREPLEQQVVHVGLGDLALPLGAFCLLRPCSTCLHEELYYPDKVDGSMVRLRSLDRGHQARETVQETRLPDGV